MTKHTNTPELRFPEFKDIWYIKQLEEIGTFKNGINKDKNSFGHGFPFINLNDVFNQDNININNLGLIDSSEKEREEYNLTKGDTLFIRSSVKPSGVGLTKVIQNDLINTVYSGFLIRFRERKKFLEDNFKSYIFSSTSVRKQIISLSSTSANTNINQDSLKKVQIVIPPLIEQAKIGIFFNKLDRQIELEEEKLELLEQQKRGYMQQIFSQDLRFKDENGDDYTAWKETTIKEIAEIKTGSKDTKDAREDGNYNFYVRSPIIHKINSYSYDGEAILTVGDGVGVGKVFHYVNGKFDYHQRVYKISDFKNYYGLLLYYYFSKNFLKEARKYNAKTSVDSVRKDMIANMKVPMPIMEEQQKIGMFLKKLESKIDYQNSKINLLKQRKRGFLQKMFV